MPNEDDRPDSRVEPRRMHIPETETVTSARVVAYANGLGGYASGTVPAVPTRRSTRCSSPRCRPARPGGDAEPAPGARRTCRTAAPGRSAARTSSPGSSRRRARRAAGVPAGEWPAGVALRGGGHVAREADLHAARAEHGPRPVPAAEGQGVPSASTSVRALQFRRQRRPARYLRRSTTTPSRASVTATRCWAPTRSRPAMQDRRAGTARSLMRTARAGEHVLPAGGPRAGMTPAAACRARGTSASRCRRTARPR